MTRVIQKRNKLGQFTKGSPSGNVALIKAVKQMSIKLLAVALIVGLNGAALSQIGYTMGYYNDTESSTENTFIAGSVDFSLNISEWQPPETAVSMAPGDITEKTVEMDAGGSNPFQYVVKSTNFTGDTDFCEGLNVNAKLEGDEMYDDPLVGLLTDPTLADPTPTLNSWEFTYTTGVNDFQNKVCDFDIDYNGWQERHNYPTYENGGFSDTEKVKNHLASWGFRINKVYYDVKSPERGVENTNEWVEIYNQTNTALDISGWQICDNTSCDTLPTTPLIPAKKYAVIVADPDTISALLPSYWYLPSEVTEINLGEAIGNGLHNNADMLVLKRPDGVIVDQMNWGDPDTDWDNYNSSVWNPGAVDVAEGNVLARVPSGHDTDMPADWTELVPPTVDLIYPDEGGSYTWYWGQSYKIKWIATNHNGPNGDLDIGIFYIKDVNHDSIISPGDTTHTIAETTANDGIFKWTVPSGFLGYIWIQLVATGPENPMLNSGTVSGKIYDPLAIFVTEEGITEEEFLAEIVAPETISATEIVVESQPEAGQSSSETPETTEPLQEATVDEAITPIEEQIEVVEDPAIEEVTDIDEVIVEESVVGEIVTPEIPDTVSEENAVEVVEKILEVIETVVETVVVEETLVVIEETPVIEEVTAVPEPTPEPVPEPVSESAPAEPQA